MSEKIGLYMNGTNKLKVVWHTTGYSYFYNNCKGKIGKWSIQNCLTFMDEIAKDWTTQLKMGDVLRTMLKKTFIKFDIQNLTKICNSTSIVIMMFQCVECITHL